MAELNGISEHLNGHNEPPPANLMNSEAPSKAIPTATQKEIIVTDYIRETLDKVAKAEGFRNFEIKIDHGSSVGDGFVGLMVRAKIQELDIHYRHKSLTVLAKIPPQNKMRREMMNSMKLFEREIYMYNVFLPEFVKFQEEHGISIEKGFYNFPKVFYAEYNEEKDDAILIMEDLRERNHKMWIKAKPMNFEHAKLLISSLGRLHGLSLAMKATKPEQFEKFKQLDDLFFKMSSSQDDGFDQYFEMSVLKAIESLEDEKRKKRAMNLMINLKEQLRECLEPENAEPFAVITHGDCWINNFLFKYDKRGAPDGVVLIDWQISRYCSPIIDLVYFLFICTDRQLRMNHWDELLNVYHRSVREIVEKVGGNIMVQLPKTALLRQLRRFGKFGVAMAAMILPMIQTKNEELVDMDFMAENMKDQDPALMEEIGKFFETHLLAGKARMREVIEDATQYGYL